MAKPPSKTDQDGAGDHQTEVKQQVEAPKPEAKQAASVATDVEQAAALVDIDPAEVFAFRLYDTKIVVVTVSGRKLEASL